MTARSVTLADPANPIAETRFGSSQIDRNPFRLIEAVTAIATRRWRTTKVLVIEMATRAEVDSRTAEYWLAGRGMGLDAFGKLMATDVGPDIFDAWIERQPPAVRQRWRSHLQRRALRAELDRLENEIADPAADRK
jgi:hypothetical protein